MRHNLLFSTLSSYALALSIITSSAFAGYSPTTHVSSDEPHSDLADDGSKWYKYHHLDPCEKYDLADPTYALEDDTAWPSKKTEFSDTLEPYIW